MAKKNFDTELKKLNPEQLKAVNTIEGPVLVTAGPGSGKTQVLTLRVANILRKTQLSAYNILCLTFTENAAVEMKKRLVKLIGPQGYDVEINTFHGFANSIIQTFPHLFGVKTENEEELTFRDFEPLDELKRLQIIEKILTKNNFQFIRPIKSTLYYLKDLQKQISDLKRENIDTEKLKNVCLDLLKSKKQKRDATLINKLNRTIELIELFEKYQKELSRNNFYDYEDMINWVIERLRKNRDIKLLLEERFQYILVDEFQDTNSSQLELLNHLTSFFKNPNLFVVGDKNQSIYRFQGASTYNIDSFKKKYPKSIKISLPQNYRSAKNIIIAANNLIDAKLISNQNEKGIIKIESYPNLDHETAAIILKIKNLIKKKIEPEEIAILVRQNKQIEKYVEALAKAKIPYQVNRGDNIFEIPFIQKIITIFKLINTPNNKIIWAEFLYYFRGQIGLKNCYELSQEKLIDTKSKIKIIQIIKEIGALAGEKNLAELLEMILSEFSLLKEIENHPERLLIFSALKTLFDDLKSAKQEKLKHWLEKIDNYQNYNLEMKRQPILYGEEKAVTIQTVHQSKGLEYEVIFLPEMLDHFWHKQKTELFYLPFNIEENLVDEERRLLYVGITRAKKAVHFSYAENNNGEEKLASRFLEELKLKVEKLKSLKVEKIINNLKSQLELTNFDASAKEKLWLQKLVTEKPLTPTGFNNYLKCPKDFLIKNILQMPSPKKPFLAYGTAIHFALETYFSQFRKNDKKPEKKILLEQFEKALAKENLSEKEFAKWLKKGRKVLSNYFAKKNKDFARPIHTEYNFGKKNIHLDGIPLTGKIDKVEVVDKLARVFRVIDYKTGTIQSRNKIKGLTKEKNTNYLNQLKFYKLLSELDHGFGEVGETRLDFIDDQMKFRTESFEFSQSEIDDLKTEIKDVWQKIQNLEFPHKNNRSRPCEYCHKFFM